MSLALSTGGIIPDQDKSQVFNRRCTSLVAQSLSTRGHVTRGKGVDIFPQDDYEETISYEDTLITLYPNGMEQRIKTVNATRRQFNLNFKVLSTTELQELWQFYQDHGGQAYPFVYVNPADGSDYVVRFANKSMGRTWLAYQLEATGLQLIEVIGE
jgi:hypothetical protein